MPIRVFLVEDVQHMHGVLAELLATVGDYEVVGTASTEAEAKLWLDENPGAWDLALIDLILEQGSGMGVIPRAKLAPDAGKVVVLSDYATPGIRVHCLKLGADAAFQKSEDMQAFLGWCSEFADPEVASA
jgi:DNA-binding NarL/FixJ family response regulator